MKLLLLVVLIAPSLSYAAIDPKYAPAYERGYEVFGDSVVFPDGSKCLLEAFNDGRCGTMWMDVDFCVAEGRYVWNEENCCDGLEAYLPEGYTGQAKCVQKRKTESKAEDSSNWYDIFLDSTMFWVGVLFPFLFLAYLAFNVKRRIKKK